MFAHVFKGCKKPPKKKEPMTQKEDLDVVLGVVRKGNPYHGADGKFVSAPVQSPTGGLGASLGLTTKASGGFDHAPISGWAGDLGLLK